MNLFELSIRKPVFAWMLMIALILFGSIAVTRIGVSQYPDIDIPSVSVSLAWEGAAPEVMETEIVDTVEEALLTVEGIKDLTSTSRQGQATVTAEFDLNRDIDQAVQDIQTKIGQVQRNLPRDMDPPVIQKINPEDQPILWLGVSSTRPLKDLIFYVREDLKNKFQTIPGVGDIILGGYVNPNIRVWLDPQKMSRLQLTAEDVVEAIRSQHSELPAGRITQSESEKSIRIMGEAIHVSELETLTISQRVRGGVLWRPYQLKDIARIEDGLEDIRRLSRVNGQTALGLGIRKQRGTNAVAIGKAIKAQVAQLQKDLPKDIALGVNFDGTVAVEENVHELQLTLVLATLLTALVCWLFLGSFGSTLNVVLAIPTALGGAFTVMYFAGFTFNTITLLGLSLVIGIVVDDSIVVLENIVRFREMGKSKFAAAFEGTKEILFSVIVISASIAAIFLPVAFMRGMIGKFFFQFGVVVSVAIAFSLLEAVTLTPMRCSRFLNVGGEHQNPVIAWMDRQVLAITQVYRNSLGWALHHKTITLVSSAFFFLATLFLVNGFKVGNSFSVRGIRKEMNPSYDIGRFLVRLQTLPGSSLDYTDQAFKKAESIAMAVPELNRYYGAIGGFGGGEVNTGMLFVTLKPPSERPKNEALGRARSQQEVMDALRVEFKKIPEFFRSTFMDLSQQQMGMPGGRSYPVDFTLQGSNLDELEQVTSVLMKKMNASGLMTDVDTDYKTGIPEIRVVPDRPKADARGVPVSVIATALQASFGGIRAGKYTRGGRRYDIRVNFEDQYRKDKNDISRISVRNTRGEMIRLLDVVTVSEKPALLDINRQNTQRAVKIFSNVASGKSQSEALNFIEKIAKEEVPQNMRVVFQGSSKSFKESFQELLYALLLGIVVAYMILAAQYNSFIDPIVILGALPFSISGAFLGLWVFDQSLSMTSVIGILLLMGLVKKNSILIVDFANQKVKEGLSPAQASLAAGPLRLRPILMTTLSTIAGALPAALHLGPGAETRAPMATVVIWGMAISTFLTLYAIPCLYVIFSKLKTREVALD